jgi:hypothetical protein
VKYPSGFIEDTLRIVINNLNDDREHLGLQVAFAQGFISDKTFEKERAQYLFRSAFSFQELINRAKILKKLIGNRITSEIIMTSFRCTLEEADFVFLEIKDD